MESVEIADKLIREEFTQVNAGELEKANDAHERFNRIILGLEASSFIYIRQFFKILWPDITVLINSLKPKSKMEGEKRANLHALYFIQSLNKMVKNCNESGITTGINDKDIDWCLGVVSSEKSWVSKEIKFECERLLIEILKSVQMGELSLSYINRITDFLSNSNNDYIIKELSKCIKSVESFKAGWLKELPQGTLIVILDKLAQNQDVVELEEMRTLIRNLVSQNNDYASKFAPQIRNLCTNADSIETCSELVGILCDILRYDVSQVTIEDLQLLDALSTSKNLRCVIQSAKGWNILFYKKEVIEQNQDLVWSSTSVLSEWKDPNILDELVQLLLNILKSNIKENMPFKLLIKAYQNQTCQQIIVKNEELMALLKAEGLDKLILDKLISIIEWGDNTNPIFQFPLKDFCPVPTIWGWQEPSIRDILKSSYGLSNKESKHTVAILMGISQCLKWET